MPDCVLARPNELSRNGFSRTRAALHSYLLQLELQGLLQSDGNSVPELRVFQPAFVRRKEFHDFLRSHLNS
jgi:hypothetical protein